MLAITAAVAFLAGMLFVRATDSPHNNAGFKTFWQSWDILEDEYYFDLPQNKDLVYGAIQGLLATTEDPYTFFVPPATAELDRQMTAGEFGGIGAHVSQNQSGQLVIVDAFPGMPADKAGLRAGDVVLRVDDSLLEGRTLDDAVGLLRGEIGSPAALMIYRPAGGRTFSVTVTRARVELPTVTSRMYGDVGYVRLFVFNATATAFVQREIENLLKQGAKALILDLRGNPGGLLDQAVGVSDLFLDQGVVVKQRARNGDEIRYRSATGDIAEGIPLIALIDGGSASASEVVAGALRDRDRAVLIGQASFGKGSVQYVHDLPDGSQLRVTVALWFTPDETPIQGEGLLPDVQVSAPDAADTDQDAFISAALNYIDDHDLAPQSGDATQ